MIKREKIFYKGLTNICYFVIMVGVERRAKGHFDEGYIGERT